MASQAQRLMSEEEVQLYFVLNGGVVRNNEIVTHFRNYLANPAIRDEARALFKVIVNKLATVKVENGEKFLVLKRQFFLPIDGNGNPAPSASQNPSYASPVLADHYQYQYQGQDPLGLLLAGPAPPPAPHNFTPFPFQAPPLYVRGSGTGYPHIPQIPDNQNHGTSPPYFPHEARRSQPNLHGSQSQFSLSATPMSNPNIDFVSYGTQPQPEMEMRRALELEWGLPPPPKQTVQTRRLSFTSPSSTNSTTGGSPGAMQMSQIIPPPYRPPPPVALSPANTSPSTGPTLRSKQLNFSSPTIGGIQQNLSSPPPPQYQRTQSVSGLRSVVGGIENVKLQSLSASPSKEHQPFFPISPQSPSVSVQSLSSLASPPPPVPPRAKRSASFVQRSPNSTDSPGSTEMEDKERGPEKKDKENLPTTPTTATTNPEVDGDGYEGSSGAEGGDSDQKISVRERMQKFNKVNSEAELRIGNNGTPRSKRDALSKDSGDYDTSSLSSFSYGYAPEPKAREWILKAARTDYAGINKMAQETPTLVRRKDINGYTALHWAAKHGHVELIKLLAGTYKSNVNAKSNGGYTPLHLAAQFSRQEVYEILIKVYNADGNLRDHSGKKPSQYLIRQDTSVSAHTVKKLKEKRRSTEHGRERESQFGNSFLRIGSLNVRVKKTTEAFGNFLAKSNSTAAVERILQKKWGSAESLPEAEMEKGMMPPPVGTSVYKSGGSSKGRKPKSRNSLQIPSTSSLFPSSPRPVSSISQVSGDLILNEERSGSESDSACGFGSEWTKP